MPPETSDTEQLPSSTKEEQGKVDPASLVAMEKAETGDITASQLIQQNTMTPTAPPDRDGQAPTQPRRRRKKQLSADNLTWGMPSNHVVNQHVQEEEGEDSWQYKIVKVLHGRRMQMFLAFLLLLDVVILFTELALLTLFPSCNLVERDGISCCPLNEDLINNEVRWLAGSDASSDYYSCAAGLEPMKDYEATCDSHKWHTVHVIEDVLICVTISILTVFFIELNALMIAITPGIYFRQMFYALDYFIVTISLGLEVMFFSLGDDALASLVGLVIVGRLWRFVRIGHGIVEIAEEMAHEQHLQEQVYTTELEDLLQQHGIPLPNLPGRHSHTPGCDIVERVERKHIDKVRHSFHHQSSGSGDSA